MAEVTAFRNNALPYPVYGVPWVVTFPLLDADGDPVTGATCDSEVAKNGDTGIDCTNEGTEIPFTTATNKGMYYLLLTAAEMTADVVNVTIYSATSKATCIALYPRKLVTLASGTSQGGAAGYITLAASTVLLNNQYNGCLCVATIDSNVEARILQVCTAANQQCTVTPNWNVTPDADDTYILYLPEGRQIPEANVRAISDDTTAANNCEADYDGTGYVGGSIVKQADMTYIHGSALTETADQLAGRFVDFFDQDAAGYNVKTALASFKATSVGITDAGLQDVAAAIHGREIWYVATDGNDGNSGRSWDQAKLTPKTVIEAAAANDLVILGPGTFALGDNVIALPTGVSVRGAGMDVTLLTSTADLWGASKGAIVKPGNQSEISDLTVHGTLTDGTYQGAFGTRETTASQTAFTNAVIRRCRGIGDADSFYIEHTSACSWHLIDCCFNGMYDSYYQYGSTSHAAVIIRGSLVVQGPSNIAAPQSRGVMVADGTLRLFDTNIYVGNDTGGGSTTGLSAGSDGQLEMFGGGIRTYGAAGGTVLDALNPNGKVTLVGVNYDRSKTSGTITDVARIVTDTSGRAHADMRAALGTALTEAGGAGRLAAAISTWGNVASPVFTAADVNQTGDSFARIGATGSGLTTITGRLPAALSGGRMASDVQAISNNTTVVAAFLACLKTIVVGTVNSANTVPTTTLFACDDITEATADHFIGRIVGFYDSGDGLFRQATDITDYEWDAGNNEAKFTVTALTEAPSDNDTIVIH